MDLDLFLAVSVCLSICLSVCPSGRLLKKLCTDFNEFFGDEGRGGSSTSQMGGQWGTTILAGGQGGHNMQLN